MSQNLSILPFSTTIVTESDSKFMSTVSNHSNTLGISSFAIGGNISLFQIEVSVATHYAAIVFGISS